MPFPLLGVLGIVSDVISKIIPDPQAAAAAKIKLFELTQAGELKELDANLQIALAQLDVNKAEALGGPYRGGWRPFIGWTCGVAFAFNYVLLPLSQSVALYLGFKGLLPAPLDVATMMPVMMGMLGLGGMRSFERSQGKA